MDLFLEIADERKKNQLEQLSGLPGAQFKAHLFNRDAKAQVF
jgi:hypothetical protein